MTGYVYRIDRRRSHDGPGLRTTVLLKGCPLGCWWCDVPETHQMEPQFIHRPDACIRCLSCLDDCKLNALSQQGATPTRSCPAAWW